MQRHDVRTPKYVFGVSIVTGLAYHLSMLSPTAHSHDIPLRLLFFVLLAFFALPHLVSAQEATTPQSQTASPELQASMLRQGLAALERGDSKAGYELIAPFALQGDPRAQYIIGLLYERGLFLPQSAGSARRWYTLAAEQGHSGAQNNLGLLLKAQDTPRSRISSYAWLSRASKQGYAKARQNLELLATELPEVEQDAAERLATDWQPKTWAEMLEELGPEILPSLPGQSALPTSDSTGATNDTAPETSDSSEKAAGQATAPPAVQAAPLHAAIAIAPESADPLREKGDLVLAQHCYARLVENAPRPANQTGSDWGGTLRPGLAQSWTAEENSRGEVEAYVFTLREGAHFQNGSPVTADDVVFSLQRMLQPNLENDSSGLMLFIQGAREYLEGATEKVSGLEIINARTIRISLHTPYAGFLAALAHPRAAIVCRAFVEQQGKEYGATPEKTCGSGLYRLESWEKGEKIWLVREKNAGSNSLAPNEVTLQITPDADKGLELFVEGEIDYLDTAVYPSLAQKLAPLAKADKQLHLLNAPRSSMYFLAVNNAAAPFDSLLTRKALQLAIDRRAMFDLGGPGAALLQGVLPPGARCFSLLPGKLAQNQEIAKEFLAQAGHPDGVTLRLAVAADRGEPFTSLEQHIKASAASAGINVELVPMSLATFQDHMTRGELHAYVGAWSAVINDADAFFHPFFSTRATVARSIRYGNGAMRTRVARAAKYADQTRRCEMYHELGRIITQQDAAWLPLFAPGRSILLGKRVNSMSLPWDGTANLPFETFRFH